MDAGVEPIHLSNGLNGFNRILAGFFLPGCDWEGETVHDDVFNSHLPVIYQGVNQPGCNSDLVLAGSCLTLFVNSQCHHDSAVLLDQRHCSLESRLWCVAILKVHRVDDGSAAN